MLEARQNVITAMLSVAAVLGGGIKSLAHYERVITSNVKDFYAGRRDASEFIDRMIAAVEEQMRRAWNDGMRANDLDPSRDMKPEWEDILQDVINSELDHILDFAEAIETAKEVETPVDGLLSRAQLWINRYNDTVNLSKLTTRPDDRYAWRLGATEQHCSTCGALNGKVATAKDWLASGYRPQNPPNSKLECGGWRCDCSLEYTEDKATQEGAPGI
jgi:hypothetical protein